MKECSPVGLPLESYGWDLNTLSAPPCSASRHSPAEKLKLRRGKAQSWLFPCPEDTWVPEPHSSALFSLSRCAPTSSTSKLPPAWMLRTSPAWMPPESFPGAQGPRFTLQELPDCTDPEGKRMSCRRLFLLRASLCRDAVAQPAKPVLGGRSLQ